MPERKHYEHAPIVEALINIQVKSPEEPVPERLIEFADLLQERFHERREILESSTRFQTDRQNIRNLSVSQMVSAIRLDNPKTHQVVIAGAAAFTFSLLAPYSQWETLKDAARREWEHYVTVFKPEQVTRIAVRFINRLDLPGSLHEVLEYVRIFPALPPKLPGGKVNAYVIQLESPQDDLEAMLVINSGRVAPPSEQPDALSILLDIDLFRDLSDKPWKLADDEPVWQYLEQLHVRKNEVFESCITDKMREMIR